MRRGFAVLFLNVVIVAAMYADANVVYEPSFFPQSAEVMAQGGSFNANARGFYSLFSNPAAYAGAGASLTILSSMPWIYAFPSPAVAESVGALIKNPVSGISGLNDLLTGPGFGAGGSFGLGYVGNSLGLGLICTADSFAWGPNTLGVNVDTNITVGFIGGFALPIPIGALTLKVGGDFRPMYRIRVPELGIATFASLLSGDSGGSQIDAPVFHGVGLAIDTGVIAEIGPLSAGIALRDLFGTTFRYSTSTVSEFLDAVKAGSLPVGNDVTSENQRYLIPMTAQLGAAFHPRLGSISKIVDPIMHVNWEVPLGAATEAGSFWTSFHAGLEVGFFSILYLRAGINQGYLTAGAGFHLLFVDLNVAYFGRELGSFAGSRQNQAVTAELAFRF